MPAHARFLNMTRRELLELLAELRAQFSGDQCWPWPLGRQHGRYGRLRWRGHSEYAHRAVASLVFGSADGALVCHRCDNPICVNPAHLFIGSAADNNADKALKGRNVNPLTDRLKQRTHCPRGHAYDAANTLWREYVSRTGLPRRARACRACLREWGRRGRRRTGMKVLHRLVDGGTCANGHALTPENAYRAPSRPNSIQCRSCCRARERNRRRGHRVS